MVGRCYRWDDRVWRVLARWAPPRECELETLVCHGHPDEPYGCGRILTVNPRDERPYTCSCSEAEALTDWHPLNTTWRATLGGPRNVLLEDIETGARTVRPFRGLRKVT